MSHLSRLDQYFKQISQQGAPDGSNGGLLDLLSWCGKLGLREVSEEEAALFLSITKEDRLAWKSQAPGAAPAPK